MPNEGFPNEGPTRPDRFEDELGAVLRSTGDSFTADSGPELVSGGLSRGRRRLVRRRLAVTGGALALAAVGIGGVYGGSLVSPDGGATKAGVAAPPVPTGGVTAPPTDPATEHPATEDPFRSDIRVKDIAAVLKANTPAGTWEIADEGGTGTSVAAVYDDGGGRAGVTVGLNRAMGDGEAGEGQVRCPDKIHVPYDACTTERLPNGSRLMILQGYEYPDRRVDTKNWRAVLLTKDGFLVDASEYNAAAEKGAGITRANPPFSPAQLKALVTAEGWRPLLEQLPVVPEKKPTSSVYERPGDPSAAAVQATLRSLLPKGLTVTDVGGQDGYAHAVVDDGEGKSLVEINVQPAMGDVMGQIFGGGDVTTLPDGRKVKLTQQAGEKGGAGVVSWTVDTITPQGFRVVVFAFNAGTQHQAATRAEPALTMEQLKTIALSPTWQKLPTT